MHTHIERLENGSIKFSKVTMKQKVLSSFTWNPNSNFYLSAKEIYQCTRSEVLVGDDDIHKLYIELRNKFRRLGIKFDRRLWLTTPEEFYEDKKRLSTDDIPEKCGVYYIWGENDKLLYIGKAINLKQRLNSHFSADLRVSVDKKIRAQCQRISYELCLNELAALLMESSEIKNLNPRYNRALKRKRTPFKLVFVPNKKGFLEPIAMKQNQETNTDLELSFSSKSAQISFLDGLYRDGVLCRDTGKGKPCFYRQIDKCEGACCGIEGTKKYNKRIMEFIEDHSEIELKKDKNFYLISKKSFPWSYDEETYSDHKLVIHFQNNEYKGFSYWPTKKPIKELKKASAEAILIHEGIDSRDNRRLIKRSLKQGQLVKAL